MYILDILRRELILVGYFFAVQFFQIARYWVFGMILGSLISVFGKQKLFTMFTAMQKKDLGTMGIIPASLIGIVSPLCMYGTIPVVVAFSENGMEEDWLAAFMVSSILLNPQLIIYSVALGELPLLVRIVTCFLCGITAGLLINIFYKDKDRKFFNFNTFNNAGGSIKNRDTDPNIFLRVLKNLFRNLKATFPALLIGVALSAIFQRYVSPDLVADFFGGRRAFVTLMVATVGVPLYFCGGATIPMLISWMQRGMSLGSAASFMIAGPAMKITNLGALKIILGAKNFAIYIIFAVSFAFFMGFLIDLIL